MYEEFKFEYARDSFGYLIKSFGIEKIYLPYYLCDVMRHKAYSENCKVLFYHVDDDFLPAQSFPEQSYILYPNYFGICNYNVNKLEKIYQNLIVDNAHAFYLQPQGVACFNSERKFRNVKNGSFLWVRNNKKEGDLANKMPNRLEIQNKKSINKFVELHEKYKKINQLQINLDSVTSPFCYPCLTTSNEEADILAENLAKDGLTIYRYWNNLPKSFNEYKFYRRLVPIPLNVDINPV